MPRPQTALEFLDVSYRQNAAALPNAEFRSVSVTRGLYNALVDELGVMERFGNAIIHERYMFRGATIQMDDNRAEWRVLGWRWADMPAPPRAARAPVARPAVARPEPAAALPEEEVWDVTFD
jgi:hypothetical protein